MKKGDKIIWDSHFGYELGYYLADKGVTDNTCLVDLITGIIHGQVSHYKDEIHLYTQKLYLEMAKKYNNIKEFPVKSEPIYWQQKNGKMINVDDMTEQHVRNTLKMLIRNDWIDMDKEYSRNGDDEEDNYDYSEDPR